MVKVVVSPTFITFGAALLPICRYVLVDVVVVFVSISGKSALDAEALFETTVPDVVDDLTLATHSTLPLTGEVISPRFHTTLPAESTPPE
jgi:hypothetical protein